MKEVVAERDVSEGMFTVDDEKERKFKYHIMLKMLS